VTQMIFLFFFFFLFFFLFLSCVHCFEVKEALCSPSYGKNKTYKLKQTTKETIKTIRVLHCPKNCGQNHSPILFKKITLNGKINTESNLLCLLQGFFFTHGAGEMKNSLVFS